MAQNKPNSPTFHTPSFFYPQKNLSTLRGFPLPKRETPKTLQTKKGATSTLPLFFHNEEGGDQSTPHTFGTESIY